jgi:hypothetical protein
MTVIHELGSAWGKHSDLPAELALAQCRVDY